MCLFYSITNSKDLHDENYENVANDVVNGVVIVTEVDLPDISDWKLTDNTDGKPSSHNQHIFSEIGAEIRKNNEAEERMEAIRKRTIGTMYKELKLNTGDVIDKKIIDRMIVWSTHFVIGQFKNSVTNLAAEYNLTWKKLKQKITNMLLTASFLLVKINGFNEKLNDKLTCSDLVKSFLRAIKDNFIKHLMQTNIYRDWLRTLERQGSFGTAIRVVFFGIAIYQLYIWWNKPRNGHYA